MKKTINYLEEEFDNYEQMASSAKNWEHLCTYQLFPNALVGKHQVVVFDSIQISCSQREGGMMHDARSPKDCISVAVIQECEDKACFDKVKLHTGDILFFDDTKPRNFMSKGKIKVIILSINKNLAIDTVQRLYDLQGYLIQDLGNIYADILESTLSNTSHTEGEIIATLDKLLSMQVPVKPKLTKGEEIALKIRDQIYHHMDGNISIERLAAQYNTSEKTLQNSFKSLFGFTPKLFLRLLKLNLVHHELKKSNPTNNNVTKIALKWGFKHMGSFSKYYTELFNENPSRTLTNQYEIQDVIDKNCISRQEEIE